MNRWVDGWMDGWMDDGWVNRLLGGLVKRSLGGWIG